MISTLFFDLPPLYDWIRPHGSINPIALRLLFATGLYPIFKEEGINLIHENGVHFIPFSTIYYTRNPNARSSLSRDKILNITNQEADGLVISIREHLPSYLLLKQHRRISTENKQLIGNLIEGGKMDKLLYPCNIIADITSEEEEEIPTKIPENILLHILNSFSIEQQDTNLQAEVYEMLSDMYNNYYLDMTENEFFLYISKYHLTSNYIIRAFKKYYDVLIKYSKEFKKWVEQWSPIYPTTFVSTPKDYTFLGFNFQSKHIFYNPFLDIILTDWLNDHHEQKSFS